jgi:hypothetical protein
MQPNICQTKYYPFPHSWSKPQLILKFETNPECCFTPFYQWNTGMPKAFYMCIMLFLPITGKYVLDFHEGIGFGVLLIRVG